MKRQTVFSSHDLDRLEARIISSATRTASALSMLVAKSVPLEALAWMKFADVGADPLDDARPLNVIEQLNQTFTYLASIAGARWLLSEHPESLPLHLNLGTTPGSDIVSACGRFVAETFSVTHPQSNNKLRKDLDRLANLSAKHRFVFYLSPKAARERDFGDVRVIRVSHPVIESLTREWNVC